MHEYIHTYIHTCIHTYLSTCIHPSINTYIHTYTHTYIHTYTHTYIPTYIHIRHTTRFGYSMHAFQLIPTMHAGARPLNLNLGCMGEVRPSIHPYIHAYIHTYVHTYIYRQILNIPRASDMAHACFSYGVHHACRRPAPEPEPGLYWRGSSIHTIHTICNAQTCYVMSYCIVLYRDIIKF
jgi:hypothetical protein